MIGFGQMSDGAAVPAQQSEPAGQRRRVGIDQMQRARANSQGKVGNLATESPAGLCQAAVTRKVRLAR